MTQRSLFDEPAVIPAKSRRTDPATSREAAERVTRSGSSASDRAAILMVVRRKPGLTAGEIAAELGWGTDNVRVSRRTAELVDNGAIAQGSPRMCAIKGSRMIQWFPVT